MPPSKKEIEISSYEGIEKFNKFTKSAVSESTQSLRIAFIGNSLTLHGPAPEIGWNNDNGMAASEKHKDYVHTLMHLRGLGDEDVSIGNFADVERKLIDGTEVLETLREILEKSPQIVIVQLGDNIASNEDLRCFVENSKILLPLIKKKAQQCLMLSTWWESSPKDEVIRQLCEICGFKYVYIGDIFTNPNNQDRTRVDFTHGGVDRHPKDWGMLQIAIRIHAALSRV